jgi:Domain of unknown function (DUF389)
LGFKGEDMALRVDHADLARMRDQLLFDGAGAACVVAIGCLFGLLVPVDVVAETNSQVDRRVHPKLIDLIAALATGAVGSFALVRPDVSDTLPGVAIAISPVPPLAVAESDRPRLNRRLAAIVVIGFVVVVSVPLAVSSVRISRDAIAGANVAPVARQWAEEAGWRVASVRSTRAGVEVVAAGALPAPDPQNLRRALDAANLGGVHVIVALVPSERVDLPPQPSLS